jgi:hypothetical protein
MFVLPPTTSIDRIIPKILPKVGVDCEERSSASHNVIGF